MDQVLRGIALAVMAGVASSLSSARIDAQAGGRKPGDITACSVLSKDEIKKAAGTHTPRYFDQIPSEEIVLPGGGSECVLAGFIVQLDAVPASAFESTRTAHVARTKYEPLSELGDEAYFYEQGPPGAPDVVGVYARVGERVFVFSMDVGAGESAALLRPAVVALAKAGAAKLR
jgi:hypothetical protein